MQTYQDIKTQFETAFAKRSGYAIRDIPREYQILHGFTGMGSRECTCCHRGASKDTVSGT